MPADTDDGTGIAEPGTTGGGPSPWGRRGRRAGIVAGVVLLVVALLPEPAVAPFVERAIERRGSECVQVNGFEVTEAGRWPAVLRAATGQLGHVSVRADEVIFNQDFPIHDVAFEADEIGVAPLRFGTDGGDAVVRGGRSSATIRFGDIERALAGIGVDAALRWDGGRLLADVQVPILGPVPTTVDWRQAGSDLELTFTALEVITLPALRIAFPEPVAFDGLGPPDGDAQPDGVRIATTVDGTFKAGAWGCDTSARSS
jgi:hypothetical protein